MIIRMFARREKEARRGKRNSMQYEFEQEGTEETEESGSVFVF